MGEAHGLGVGGGDAANSDAIQLVNHGPEDRWRDGPHYEKHDKRKPEPAAHRRVPAADEGSHDPDHYDNREWVG